MNFTYDPQAAADADSGAGGKYLSETGSYVGKIIKATGKKTSKGGDSVNIAFECADGRKAEYLTLQINSASGEKYFGYGVLMAVLRCANVRTISAVALQGGKPGEVEYKELEGKPVGVLLQASEYLKKVKDDSGRQTGEELATRMELVAAFCPKTRRMASEIDKNVTAPTQLDRFISMLDPVRKMKRKPADPSRASGHQQTESTAAGAGAFVEDDIPFAPIRWKECM